MIADINARNQAAGERWFDNQRDVRRRFESAFHPLSDGGCVFVVTEQDGTAPRGTAHSRIPLVMRQLADGRIVHVELGWLENVTQARRVAEAFAAQHNNHK